MANKLQVSAVFKAVDKMTKPVKRAQKSIAIFSQKTKRSMGISSKAVQKANKKSIDSFKKFGKSIAVAGVATIGAGFAAATVGMKKFAAAGDEIAKTSRQVGVSAESLQSLRFAADRQGVSSATLTGSLQKLNKNVGDLRAGTGMLRTNLMKTNPALAEQLKNAKSNGQAFNLMIGAINKLPNSADKAALAQAAFGRAGQEVIKMAEIGVSGIQKLQNEFASLGGVISDEATLSAEQYTDAMANMQVAMKSTFINTATAIMPKLTVIVDKITLFVQANKALIQQKLEVSIKAITTAFKIIIPVISFFIRNLKIILIVFSPLIAALTLYGISLLPTIIMTKALSIQEGYLAVKTGVMTVVTWAQTAAQWALNAAMNANPIGLIILGIIATIAVTVIIIKYWDKVKAVMKKAFDNKIIVALIAVFFPLIAVIGLVIKHFGTIKQVSILAWQGIKIGFKATIDFLKMYFFTFVDVFLTYFGTIVKVVLSAAKLAGKALGFDTSGLDKVINKISEVQGKVREQSLIGAAQSKIEEKIQANAELKASSKQQTDIDVNFNNAPQGTSVKSSNPFGGLKLNMGVQPAL